MSAHFEFFCPALVPVFKKERIESVLESILKDFDKRASYMHVIFMTDEALLEMNKQYLQHDEFTDVITFPLGENDDVCGEIYISIDRVRDNAKRFELTFLEELHRVIIHGVLHLVGLNDRTEKEKTKIRKKEDFYLNQIQQNSTSHFPSYYVMVYDLVRRIPSGKVSTYGRIADYLSLGSARMVGWALNQLKASDVPAHRVVNRNGELTGRVHFGAPDVMADMLTKEGVRVQNNKIVNLQSHLWSPEELINTGKES